MTVQKSQWKTLEFDETFSVDFKNEYSKSEYEKIKRGLLPKAMEDKWFIYFTENTLYFHRSWTGLAVCFVSFHEISNESAKTHTISFAEQFKDDDFINAEVISFIITNLLLGQSKPFPKPANTKEPIPGVLQHHISGTGYSEKTIEPKKPWWRLW